MRLRTTKVFIDSRYAIGGSGSSILYEIPGGVEVGPNARCFVSEFTCVCAWPTLDDSNRHQTVVTGTGAIYVLALPVGSYDLDSFAAALETALVQEIGPGFQVERTGVGNTGSTQQLLHVSHPSISFMLADGPMSRIVSWPQVSATAMCPASWTCAGCETFTCTARALATTTASLRAG